MRHGDDETEDRETEDAETEDGNEHRAAESAQ